MAPDHVYDAALAWVGRFVGAPAAALAGAKALIDDAPCAEAQVRRHGQVFAAVHAD